MKTFDEMLPTATAEMREFVKAYDDALGEWLGAVSPTRKHPLEIMRSTPPAKEPVSVEAVIVQYSDGSKSARIVDETTIKPGDRVRVTKIEEA